MRTRQLFRRLPALASGRGVVQDEGMKHRGVLSAGMLMTLLSLCGCGANTDDCGCADLPANRETRAVPAEEAEKTRKTTEAPIVQKDPAETTPPVADLTDEQWRERLSPEAFYVLRQKGTEPRFSSGYSRSKKPGNYLCGGCGTELFSSVEKYESGTGWPSFWAPAVKANVSTVEDNGFFSRRTEVLCAKCDGHLGHVFDDGPAPTGLRYCINGISLKFVESSRNDDEEDDVGNSEP